jgi:two-component system sensor kinase ParS
LLFRSYLVLAGGLLAVAFILDFGFGRLQDQQRSEADRWLEATFYLIESSLAAVSAEERANAAAALADRLGTDVQLLDGSDVHQHPAPAHGLIPLIDDNGNTSYLYQAESLDAIVRLGPIAEVEESALLKLLPPLFYLSILVVVGLWLRPLLKDIDVISSGAQRFAADYREPLNTAEQTTELKPLASNLDDMAARLSGLLRSQKELIAALSHEMRTPLARLRFALAIGGEQANDKMKGKLADMNQDVQEIDDLIASMLNYARLDHPEIEMRWQAVPAVPWLEQIVGKATCNGIRIRLAEDGIPDQAWMDPHLMELALSNLLVNATKYAHETVDCSLSVIDGDYVLTVEDDGQGIPDEARERVFKAFTRIDDSRSRRTGGYGLGLAIVARVAELHGGKPDVATSPGLGGALVSLRWPISEHRGDERQ